MGSVCVRIICIHFVLLILGVRLLCVCVGSCRRNTCATHIRKHRVAWNIDRMLPAIIHVKCEYAKHRATAFAAHSHRWAPIHYGFASLAFIAVVWQRCTWFNRWLTNRARFALGVCFWSGVGQVQIEAPAMILWTYTGASAFVAEEVRGVDLITIRTTLTTTTRQNDTVDDDFCTVDGCFYSEHFVASQNCRSDC